MRFKKLRISVGVALIIFILLIGNIIVFGELVKDKSSVKSSLDQNLFAMLDDKKLISQNFTIETQPKLDTSPQSNQEIKNANNKNTNPTSKPIPKVLPPSNQIIVHTKLRTRAS